MKCLILASMAALVQAGHDAPDSPPQNSTTGPPTTMGDEGWEYNANENEPAKCYGLVRYGTYPSDKG